MLSSSHEYSCHFLLLTLLAATWPNNCSAQPLGRQLQALVNEVEPLNSNAPAIPTLSATNAAAQQEELRFSMERLNYDGIHRMLRNENEQANYRREDTELRYYQKRAAQQSDELHQLFKRDLPTENSGLLNLSAHSLSSYDSRARFKGQASAIRRIDLSNNELTELQLEGFSQLLELDVRNNSLSALALQPASSNSLVTLNLACNRFGQLKPSFFERRMPQLQHLNLAHNQLGNVVGRETFYNLLNLQTLLLSGNNITDIDYETFLALPNLQHLDLSHNRLRQSAIRALQGIPDLMSLSIAYNPDVGAAMQEFVASWSLKELDASGTGLCQVPAALAQSVRTLKLSFNWLRSINCGDLDSYPLLQYLDLSHSRIALVEDDALGRLELLELLFLDHNRLTRVPASLPVSLEHLFLQHNRIIELQPDAFVGLTSLKTLDLSGNRLIYLPALPLPKLLTLNLQAAGIESVSQALVHTLPELRDLLLEDNPVKCTDLLAIAEWASPCRSEDMGQPRPHRRIDLKQQFIQEPNTFENFKSNCRRQTAPANDAQTEDKDDGDDTEAPNCGLTTTTTITTMTVDETMPKVEKSEPAATTITKADNNIPLPTTKTLRSTETTSLAASAEQQLQQMPGMPTPTAAAAATATVTLPPKSAERLPSTVTTPLAPSANSESVLAATGNEKSTTAATTRQSAINFEQQMQTITTTKTTSGPKRRLTTANSAAIAVPTAPAATTIAVKRTAIEVPQTILALIKSDKAPAKQQQQQQQQQQQLQDKDKSSASLLKQQTVGTTAAAATTTDSNFHANANLSDTSGQASTKTAATIPAMSLPPSMPLPHKHAPLQLHIKDRHLIGTPLLMHKGDNLLVDAEHLLLPGTATVDDGSSDFGRGSAAAEALDAGQQQSPELEQSDKRQAEVIKAEGDTKLATTTTMTPLTMGAVTTTKQHKALAKTSTHKKKPSLSIKKMTYSTKHAMTAATTLEAGFEQRHMAALPLPLLHQHSSVNTPNFRAEHELSTFAEQRAFEEFKTQAYQQLATEASKSAHLLDIRQSNDSFLSSNHPGLVLLASCVLIIVLLAGLAHVYRCELPWQRRRRPGQMRPHHQRQFNDADDAHSFLHYQGPGSASNVGDPARLHKWHHSTRREAPYSSPLHNLHVRELQREQEKLRRCQQFYSASLSVSGSGSGSASSACSSSRSSLHSPTTGASGITMANDDSYYIEMAPSGAHMAATGATVADAAPTCLPMELLATKGVSGNNKSSGNSSSSSMAATELGGTAGAAAGEAATSVLTAAAATTTATATTATSTLKAMSSKLMAPSSRRLGLW